MYIQTNGLVLRETEYRESSRIITVLTATHGKLTVSAKGAKRKGSKIAASTQLLAYSEMTLFAQRDRYILTEARSLELFRGLRESLEGLALGSYFAELLDTLSDEDVPDPELLPLGLNALYAVSENVRENALVKAAFELKLLCQTGFAPELAHCCVCGGEPVDPVISLDGGTVRCRSCGVYSRNDRSVPKDTLSAMRYVSAAAVNRFCSFSLKGEPLRHFADISEEYLLAQLGRRFYTLDFYHSLVGEVRS